MSKEKIQPNMQNQSPFSILINQPMGEVVLEQLTEECNYLKIQPQFST